MKIAVLGAAGQFGSELVDVGHAKGYEIVPFTHEQCDVTSGARSINSILSSAGITYGDAVVNCANGLFAADAETWPQKAFEVSAFGARNVASACESLSARCVYISSDYVFDGVKGGYVETDAVLPINVYGAAKFAGEVFTRAENSGALIARVSSLFGPGGRTGNHVNFVERMAVKAKAGEDVQVVGDVFMTPTYTRDAARLLLMLLEDGAPTGTYHLSNFGGASWANFAETIYDKMESTGHVIPQYNVTDVNGVRRPKNSVLNSRFVGARRHWIGALDDYLHRIGYLPNDYDAMVKR